MPKNGEAKASLPYKFRHLHHIDLVDHYQFITFRTHDSVDAFVKKLALQNKTNQQRQMKVDEYLDQSIKGAYLYGAVLHYLFQFLKSHDGDLYELISFAIMPNHVHLLLKPKIELPVLMQRIKGSSSIQINTILKRTGKFWSSNYYDKLIRDDRNFILVYDYIKNNPLKLDDNFSGAKAPLPSGSLYGSGSEALASPVNLNRFFGVYEDKTL